MCKQLGEQRSEYHLKLMTNHFIIISQRCHLAWIHYSEFKWGWWKTTICKDFKDLSGKMRQFLWPPIISFEYNSIDWSQVMSGSILVDISTCQKAIFMASDSRTAAVDTILINNRQYMDTLLPADTQLIDQAANWHYLYVLSLAIMFTPLISVEHDQIFCSSLTLDSPGCWNQVCSLLHP